MSSASSARSRNPPAPTCSRTHRSDKVADRLRMRPRIGLKDPQAEAAVLACTRHYRERTIANAERPALDVWYQSIPVEAVLDALLPSANRKERKKTEKALHKAETRTNLGALHRFAEQTEHGWRIKPEPPLIVAYERREDLESELDRLMEEYAETLSSEDRVLLSATA